MPQLTNTHVTQPDTPKPNIVQGKRKCRLTEHLCENGGPLSCQHSSTLFPIFPIFLIFDLIDGTPFFLSYH